MRVYCAVCVETCWSAPSRHPVNMLTAAPASAPGWSITTPVLRTDCHWMWVASNHCTGQSPSPAVVLLPSLPRNHALLSFADKFMQVSSVITVSCFSHCKSFCLCWFDCRYMRNDLNRLQIRCVNAAQGCEVVCSLESLHSHEDECEFAFISCANTGT